MDKTKKLGRKKFFPKLERNCSWSLWYKLLLHILWAFLNYSWDFVMNCKAFMVNLWWWYDLDKKAIYWMAWTSFANLKHWETLDSKTWFLLTMLWLQSTVRGCYRTRIHWYGRFLEVNIFLILPLPLLLFLLLLLLSTYGGV